jgi:hypothetical protein
MPTRRLGRSSRKRVTAQGPSNHGIGSTFSVNRTTDTTCPSCLPEIVQCDRMPSAQCPTLPLDQTTHSAWQLFLNCAPANAFVNPSARLFSEVT